MLRRSIKGQSTAEYAIVIGLVIAAVLAMQVYVKRGIQGKVRDASDADIASTGGTDYGVNSYTNDQFEPDYSTQTDMVSTRNSTGIVKVYQGGKVERNIDGEDVSTRTGKQEILAP